MRAVKRSKALIDVYDGREQFQSRIWYLETFRRRLALVVMLGIAAAGAARHGLNEKRKPPCRRRLHDIGHVIIT
jgi:hypothetical protein